MSDYSKTTNFTAKDSLPSGNAGKIVKGAEIDVEFTAIQTAVNSKADEVSPSLSGTIALAAGATISTNSVSVSDVELGYLDGATSNLQTQITTEVTNRTNADLLKADLASPALTGTPTAPTAATGTNTTQIATTAFTNATAFNTALPSQTGNSGKYVTTNGTDASWVALSVTQDWVAKTTTYTAVNGNRISADTTGGAFTITLPATPSTGHYVEFTDGAGTWATAALTIARNGSTIMGLSEDMTCSTNNDSFGLVYNGSTWRFF